MLIGRRGSLAKISVRTVPIQMLMMPDCIRKGSMGAAGLSAIYPNFTPNKIMMLVITIVSRTLDRVLIQVL